MKSISIFILLIYWSVIIFAPVLAKDGKLFKKQSIIIPKVKPNK
tara:strand:+ start:462 stop:593 length:132 start_codon:yes stop_codon:yes gene_type:complete